MSTSIQVGSADIGYKGGSIRNVIDRRKGDTTASFDEIGKLNDRPEELKTFLEGVRRGGEKELGRLLVATTDTEARDVLIKGLIDQACKENSTGSPYTTFLRDALKNPDAPPGNLICDYLNGKPDGTSNKPKPEETARIIPRLFGTIDRAANNVLGRNVLAGLLTNEETKEVFSRGLRMVYRTNVSLRDEISTFAEKHPNAANKLEFTGGRNALVMHDTNHDGIYTKGDDNDELSSMSYQQLLLAYNNAPSGDGDSAEYRENIITALSQKDVVSEARTQGAGGGTFSAMSSVGAASAVGLIIGGPIGLAVGLTVGLAGGFSSLVGGAEHSKNAAEQYRTNMADALKVASPEDLRKLEQFIKDGGLKLLDKETMAIVIEALYDNINDGAPNAERIADKFIEATDEYLNKLTPEGRTSDHVLTNINTALKGLPGWPGDASITYDSNNKVILNTSYDVTPENHSTINTIVRLIKNPESANDARSKPNIPRDPSGWKKFTKTEHTTKEGILVDFRTRSRAVTAARAAARTGNTNARYQANVITAAEFSRFSEADIDNLIRDIYAHTDDADKALEIILEYATALNKNTQPSGQGTRLIGRLMDEFYGKSGITASPMTRAVNNFLATENSTTGQDLLLVTGDADKTKARVDRTVEYLLKHPSDNNYAALRGMLLNDKLQGIVIKRLDDAWDKKGDGISEERINAFLHTCSKNSSPYPFTVEDGFGRVNEPMQALLDRLDAVANPADRQEVADSGDTSASASSPPAARAGQGAVSFIPTKTSAEWKTALEKEVTSPNPADTNDITFNRLIESASAFLGETTIDDVAGTQAAVQALVNKIDGATDNTDINKAFNDFGDYLKSADPQTASAVKVLFAQTGYAYATLKDEQAEKSIYDPTNPKGYWATQPDYTPDKAYTLQQRAAMILEGITKNELRSNGKHLLRCKIVGGAKPGSDYSALAKIRNTANSNLSGLSDFTPSQISAINDDMYLHFIARALLSEESNQKITLPSTVIINYDGIEMSFELPGIAGNSPTIKDVLDRLLANRLEDDPKQIAFLVKSGDSSSPAGAAAVPSTGTGGGEPLEPSSE